MNGLIQADVRAFLRLCRQRQLVDLVLIGGAVRDLWMQRRPRDLDVTFCLCVSEQELALAGDAAAWNEALGARLQPRIDALAFHLGISTDGLLRGEAQFRAYPVHYVGPFSTLVETDGVAKRYRSRLGVIVTSVGDVVGQRPLTSIEAVGLTTDKAWVGKASEAREDIRARLIRRPEPIRRLRVEQVLRVLYYRAVLGFECSVQLIDALHEFALEASRQGTYLEGEAQADAPTVEAELTKLTAALPQELLQTELARYGLSALLGTFVSKRAARRSQDGGKGMGHRSLDSGFG